MSETELKTVPELCPDQDGLDTYGIQSSGLITKNPGDDYLKDSASFVILYTTTLSV